MNENNMPLSLMMENAKGAMTDAFNPVSYTHLDVYKRQTRSYSNS